MPSVKLVGSKHQAALVGEAGRRDAGNLQPPQLDQWSVCRPQGGDIVRRIALPSQLQEQVEHDWTVPQAASQLLAQEVRAARASIIRGEVGLTGLGYPPIAAESVGASAGR
jgi:hypothetical protein